MIPRFDPTVTLGNVAMMVTFAVAALFAWRDLNWRVKNLETWKEAHIHSAEEAIRNITMLREAIVGIQKLSEATERRLILLEDRTEGRWGHHQ